MPFASTDCLMRATVSSTEWLLTRRRTPAASVVALAVTAVEAALADVALASKTVMQNKRRNGFGALERIIGQSPVDLCRRNAASARAEEIGRCYRIHALGALQWPARM